MQPNVVRTKRSFFMHRKYGIWLTMLMLLRSLLCIEPSHGDVLEHTANATILDSLDNFTVIDFLQDILREDGFQNLLFMQNQNATIARSFVCRRLLVERVKRQAPGDAFTNETYDLTADAKTTSAEQEIAVHDFVSDVMSALQIPMFQFNEMHSYFLKQRFSVNMLTMVYIDGALSDHTGLLKSLPLNLRQMTVSKVLFLLNYTTSDLGILQQLFQYCWKNKMINVAVLMVDYQKTATFYSYTAFPQFEIEVKPIFADIIQRKNIYPDRMSDLKGYKLPYIIGGSDPRIIVYLNNAGQMVILGFAEHFLRAFAQKYNCTLYEPMPAKINAFAPAQDLIAAVRNGTVEISAGLTFPSIPMQGYSYPYEQMNWCVMIPVEPDVPGYEFFVLVFELSAFLITLALIVLISMVLSRALFQHGYKADIFDVFLHDDCLRGALGQPFSEVLKAPLIIRFIYLQICVLGILLTTSYNAYFATYVTSAPKEPPLRTFDDILNSGIKVYAWTPEYGELLGRVAEFKKYVPMFHLENNYQTYLKVRDSFSTKYAYMMPTTKWNIISEQQKIFTTPIFRRRDDLCFFNNIPMCFPVHENSIFMEIIYNLILITAESGLTYHWMKIGFLEMIIAGKLTFADLSTKREFKAMEVNDLRYIWFGLGTMVVVVIFVFLTELLVFYHCKIWNWFTKPLGKCCRHKNRNI